MYSKMDGLDRNKKNGSSGHDSHGVHVCHKCGWPFPNPHPSAKHRRSHKKVCGTIERYKLNESDSHHPHLAASDDEHASDEDHQTPSPKIEKGSMKDLGSSGEVGEKANVSEDEVFTDAVTELSDSGVSPGMEEHVTELNKDAEKVLKTDPGESQLSKVDATSDTVVPLNDSKESSKEVLDIAKDLSESDKSSYGIRSEEFPVQYHEIVGSRSYMKSETPTDVLIDETSAKVCRGTEQEAVVNENDIHMDKSLMTIEPHGKTARNISKLEFNLEETGIRTLDALTQEPLMQKVDQERESGLKEPKGKSPGCETLETVVPKPVTRDYKLPEGLRQTSALSSSFGIVGQKKDVNDEVETNMGKNGTSPLVEQKKDESDFVPNGGSGYSKIVEGYRQREEVEDDMLANSSEKEQEEMRISGVEEPKEKDLVCYLREVEKDELQAHGSIDQKEARSFNSLKEENQNMYSQSVTTSLPVIHNVDTVIEGVKDHNASESTLPLHNLAFAGVMTSVQDDNNTTIVQAGYTGLHSGDTSGSADSSSADTNALRNGPDEKDVEKSVEGKEDISGMRHDRSCGLESLPDTPGTETQNIQTDNNSECLHLHSTDSEAVQKGCSEDAMVDQLDIKCVVLTEEVEQVTNLHEVENAENNEANKSEKCGITGHDTCREEPIEDELSANKKTSKEHADGSFIAEDNQTSGSIKADGDQDHDTTTAELLDIARCESIAVCGGTNFLKHTEATHDAAGQLSESTDLDNVPDKVVDAWGNLEQTYSSLPKCADESSQEASRGFGTSNITDVVKTADSTAKDIEADCNGILLASNENPEDSMSKEAASLHVETEPLNKNSSTVELTYSREAVKSASGCNLKPSQDEGKHRFQPHGVSVIDTLVASSSQTDILECNWGSVSVVSTQSDTTATADAGGLPFSAFQQPEKSVVNLQMPKDASNPDKSDVHEPPTLMTLAVSEEPISRKAAPEIQTAQNIEQPKPEDLLIGSFPSAPDAVNESHVRKNNEEIVEKVSNRSTEKQHNPLKNFLSEAKSPDTEQEAPLTKGNCAAVTTVNAILHAEEPNDQDANKDMGKEWNSPARYPSQIKKERKKGRPYWVPFVCCSSVHRDF